MKNPSKLWVSGARTLGGTVLAFFLTGLVLPSQADTLNNGNSVVTLDLAGGGGMTSWTVDGQNQLAQQWFWYRVGSSPEAPINAISAPVVSGVVPPLGRLAVSYANSDYSVSILYLLTGGNTGSGRSSLGQQITIANNTSSTLDFHFFQYSDYNLLNSAAGQSIVLSSDPSTATQQSGSSSVANVVIPSDSHQEAASDGHILASLMDGLPTTLLDNSGIPAGPGNANYAFEWDFSIGPGSTAPIISTLVQVQVPEPSAPTLTFFGLALAALTICRRRQT